MQTPGRGFCARLIQRFLLIISTAVFISSCADETLNSSQTLSINGSVYKLNSTKPFTGTVITKHKNGVKIKEVNYKNGKEHGLYKFWRTDGSKDFVARFNNGKETGVHTFWRKNGNKKHESNYKNGALNGSSTWFDADGKKMKEFNYQNDKKHGIATWWNKDGSIWIQKEYKNGKEIK